MLRCPSHRQVAALDLGLGIQIGPCALENNLARVNDIKPIGAIARKPEILLAQKNAIRRILHFLASGL
jgi:hypothetical protein